MNRLFVICLIISAFTCPALSEEVVNVAVTEVLNGDSFEVAELNPVGVVTVSDTNAEAGGPNVTFFNDLFAVSSSASESLGWTSEAINSGICTLPGVTCVGTTEQLVGAIAVTKHVNFGGAIPSSINLLGPNVTAISLPHCGFKGPIPTMVDLVGLRQLNLANNSLTGLPVFAANTLIEEVDIAGNKLELRCNSTVPAWASATSLASCDLSDNHKEDCTLGRCSISSAFSVALGAYTLVALKNVLVLGVVWTIAS